MKILITGITGTIGTKLCEMLLKDGHEVVGLSRDEFKQHKFPYKNDVKLYIDNLREPMYLNDAAKGCCHIIHTAALKHVDLMEKFPLSCIQTNIIGTQNVLNAQMANDVPKVTLLSTDKAVYPINVYGMSKGIAERLVLQNPNNAVVRYGNVLNSRGSVIPMFAEQIKKGGPVKITDLRMTRFWIKIEDAAQFILDSIYEGIKGLCVPEMKGARVVSLVEAIADVLGVRYPEFEVVGIRPGEKINECLLTRTELVGQRGSGRHGDIYSDNCPEFYPDELIEMVRGEL